MDRRYWLDLLRDVLEPIDDPTLAEAGVMKPRQGFRVSFVLTFEIVSVFQEWDMLTSNETTACIRPRNNGEEDTFILFPWEKISSVSVTVESGWGLTPDVIRERVDRFYLGLAPLKGSDA